MGCCNNKKDCNNNKELPKEEMGSFNYVGIFTSLIDVVKTGKLPALFKNPAADQLAIMIANVVDENRYLRALLGVMRPDVVVNDEAFSIAFGPGKQYCLTIPVTTEGGRQELIGALHAAIEKLEQAAPPVTTKQLPLFNQDN